MEIWIPITIGAAFLQNIRSAVQKHLKGALSTAGATYVRFLFALPFAIFYVWGLHQFLGISVPQVNRVFAVYIIVGAFAQIAFTGLLVWMFSFRNFAVGTTFSKTETIQVAILGYLFLGDSVTPAAAFALFVSVVGVMVLSAGQSGLSVQAITRGLGQRSTLAGLASGFCLGITAVSYRGAALSLNHESVVMAAGFTLLASLIVQTAAMGIYLAAREPDQWQGMRREWKWSTAVGVAAVMASIFWMTAVTLQNAAYVRALGQIELAFTFLSSWLLFGEKITTMETIGTVLVIVGIIILLTHGIL